MSVAKIVGGAIGAVSVAGNVARHVAWYLSHHVNGSHNR